MLTFAIMTVIVVGFSSYIVFCDAKSILTAGVNETVAATAIVNKTLQLYSSLTEFLQETIQPYGTTLVNGTSVQRR